MRRWLVCFLIALPSIGLGSTCYGTVAQGRLEQGVQLPKDGANFAAYSTLFYGAGAERRRRIGAAAG